MSFCAAINCMDGRVQLPVIAYLKQRLGVDYVDIVSEAGPPLHLAERPESAETASILRRLDVSITKHGTRTIALVAHHDCAGNPLPRSRQEEQVQAAAGLLAERHPAVEVLGLWVDDNWRVHEICTLRPASS